MLPAQSTRRPLLLIPAPRAACLCLPPFPVLFSSPLFHPRPSPGSLSSPGEFSCRGSICASVSLSRPPWFLLWILELSGPWDCCQVVFCENLRGRGASTPWQLRALVLAPPATWPCRRRSRYPFTPIPPLPYRCDIIPVSRRSMGCSAKSPCYGRL